MSSTNHALLKASLHYHAWPTISTQLTPQNYYHSDYGHCHKPPLTQTLEKFAQPKLPGTNYAEYLTRYNTGNRFLRLIDIMA